METAPHSIFDLVEGKEVSWGKQIGADETKEERQKWDDISRIVAAFDEFNPGLAKLAAVNARSNKAKGLRKAVKELIEAVGGMENARRITYSAIVLQGNKYAPIITNPQTLANKLPELLIFLKRNKKILNQIRHSYSLKRPVAILWEENDPSPQEQTKQNVSEGSTDWKSLIEKPKKKTL